MRPVKSYEGLPVVMALSANFVFVFKWFTVGIGFHQHFFNFYSKNIQPIDFFTNFAKQTHFEDTSFILLIGFNHGRTKITDHRGGFLLDEETIR